GPAQGRAVPVHPARDHAVTLDAGREAVLLQLVDAQLRSAGSAGEGPREQGRQLLLAALAALRDHVRRLVLPVPGVDGAPASATAGCRGYRRADSPRPSPEPELRPAAAQVCAGAEQPAALLPPDGYLLLLAGRA